MPRVCSIDSSSKSCGGKCKQNFNGPPELWIIVRKKIEFSFSLRFQSLRETANLTHNIASSGWTLGGSGGSAFSPGTEVDSFLEKKKNRKKIPKFLTLFEKMKMFRGSI